MPVKAASIVRVVLFTIAATLFFRLVFGPNPPEGKDIARNFRRPKLAKSPKEQSAMASNYMSSLSTRRSVYALTKSSTIPNSRIQEIVANAIKHTPSAFNSQAGRVVIFFGSDHDQLWDYGNAAAKEALPPPAYEGLKDKIAGFRAAYGSVLFFEDSATLDTMKARTPGLPFDQWSEHSSGMLQVHVWDSLSLEGLGANLQHYNFMPSFQKLVREHWKLPETWDLKSQLVFGTPNGPPREKQFEAVEGKRLLTFGA